MNDAVMKLITDERQIFMTPSVVKGRTILRFVVCHLDGDDSHIKFAWDVIRDATQRVLETM